MIDRDGFAARFDVSRETLDQLDTYAALLAEWQQRMNLVGPSTLPQLWDRHFADSAQLFDVAGRGRSWLDVGTGAGFPGLIVAILDPTARVLLVESIAKKCRFLEHVASSLALGPRVTIANRRVESLPPQKFDIVTARALAALEQLYDWCLPFAGSGTHWLLPKGARFADELATASKRFGFDYRLVESITDPAARIIIATGVRRR